MAGTVNLVKDDSRTIKKLTFSWTSNSTGCADYSTSGVSGILYRCVIKPTTAATQPTSNYDVLINDANSVDLLGGQGGNLSKSTSSNIVFGTTGINAPTAFDGVLTLDVAQAGSAKTGTVIMYYR